MKARDDLMEDNLHQVLVSSCVKHVKSGENKSDEPHVLKDAKRPSEHAARLSGLLTL